VGTVLVLLAACSQPAEEAAPPATPTPPAEVVALVDGVLTEAGERSYYEAEPRLLDREAFQAACPNDSELTVVLGCYSDGTISILRIERPELTRVMEVTAAHEMLHAVYAGLAGPERRQVDGWIEEFYAGLVDPDIRDVVGQYERSEPRQRLNELHSILATEVGALSPALETYYGRYFTDRRRVVAANESYEGMFREIRRRVDKRHGEIEQLCAQLRMLDGRIATKKAQLEAVEQQLKRLDAQGDVRAYNALIPRQNALVEEATGVIDRFNELVDLHNAKVDQVNGLALRQDELVSDLGSRPSIPRGAAR